MEKDQTTIGLSREFIIHPGETLQEILEEREMSQKELAVRTGVTEKHISTIINGSKPISVAFAKKLEYALGFESLFWINLQSLYDRELLEFEELYNISDEEIAILKNLKEVIAYLDRKKILNINDNIAGKVLDLRRFMGISDLRDVPNLATNAAFRAQVANANVDVHVLFAWQKICELLTQDIAVAREVDIEKLKSKIPQIKKLMFEDAKTIQRELEDIFAECGIGFKIVQNFKGAPVQGFIKMTENDNMILCMTLRRKYADIFWFTLFHEMAHIIYKDTKNKFIDFETRSNEMEERADRFAKNTLLNPTEYKRFVAQGDFALEAIEKFADECSVRPFIVIGRLMKEGEISWNSYNNERVKYVWAN
ncbi:MAG: HigA family addiction module antitoxin [Lachnospiraceae bacterium]